MIASGVQQRRTPSAQVPRPVPISTLAIDVGGTGLKAAVLDANGAMISDRLRVPTTYPMPPERLVAALKSLVAPLPPYDRASVGFPGVVRNGRVLTAPNLATLSGPGSMPDSELVGAWAGFDLTGALAAALGCPVRVANDADLQGSAVVSGKGLEFVVTLGTGVGTALFVDGRLAPHLELSQHPLAKGETYDERLGEATRERIGTKRWRPRVLDAIEILHTLLNYDRLYIGGGNSGRLQGYVGKDVILVDNTAGLLGGITLWEHDAP